MSLRAAASLTAVLALCASLAPLPAATAAEDTVIDVLAVTDLHGHLPQVVRNDVITEIGAAVMACEIDRYRAANPNTTFVSVGDNIGASAWVSAAAYDDPTIEVLNAMGLEVSAVGNHEFDTGWRDLNSRIAGGARLDFAGNPASPAHTYTAPVFEYLGANASGMEPALAGTHIVEQDGVRVAYIGAVTGEMDSLVPAAAIEGISFHEPAASVNAQAAKVRAEGLADVVVALVHEDAADTAAMMSGAVDVLIGGHTHVELVNNAATGRDGQPIVVLQPANFGQRLGRVEIRVSDTGEVSATASSLSGADMSPECLTSPDQTVADIIAEAQVYADVQGKVPVATVAGSFFRGQFVNTAGDVEENRGTESTMSNLVADGARHWGLTLANPDELPVVGVANSGGVRGDLAPNDDGEVTYEDARTIQPFSGTKGFNDMTGALVHELLEQQWQPDGATRPMLKLGLSSNLRYTFDPAASAGDRIREVWIDGSPVADDDSRTYRFVGDAFVLMGGDGYTAFRPENYTDSGTLDLTVFIDYLRELSDAGTPAAPDFVTRAVGLELPDTMAAGDAYEVRVSGLAMSAPGELRPAEVTVKVGDITVGTAPVTFDNQMPGDGIVLGQLGEATVTVTLPADMASGVATLEFYTDLADHEVASAPVVVQGADLPGPAPTVEPVPQPTTEPAPKPTTRPTTPVRPGLPRSGV